MPKKNSTVRAVVRAKLRLSRTRARLTNQAYREPERMKHRDRVRAQQRVGMEVACIRKMLRTGNQLGAFGRMHGSMPVKGAPATLPALRAALAAIGEMPR
jgi:hypothetical protein